MAEHYDTEILHKLQDELTRYAVIEGTEIGEATRSLIEVTRYPDYVGQEFLDAAIKEMTEQLANYKECSRIVTKKMTHEWEEEQLEWL